jgi:hypothetical protein
MTTTSKFSIEDPFPLMAAMIEAGFQTGNPTLRYENGQFPIELTRRAAQTGNRETFKITRLSSVKCPLTNLRKEFPMPQTISDDENIVQKGLEIYEKDIRTSVERENYGKVIAIDIDSGAFEMDSDGPEAVDRLRAAHPNARIALHRIGFPSLYKIGAFPRGFPK